MKNYVIHFDPSHHHRVIEIVRRYSNDIIIDYINEDSIAITVERDDEDADVLYQGLRSEVKRQLEALDEESHFVM